MIEESRAADPHIHAEAAQAARQCVFIVQAVLREEEWGLACQEFYRVIRERMERLAARKDGPRC